MTIVLKNANWNAGKLAVIWKIRQQKNSERYDVGQYIKCKAKTKAYEPLYNKKYKWVNFRNSFQCCSEGQAARRRRGIKGQSEWTTNKIISG
jgi:hypothetical protein